MNNQPPLIIDENKILESFRQGSSYKEVKKQFYPETMLSTKDPSALSEEDLDYCLEMAEIVENAYTKFLFPNIKRIITGTPEQTYTYISQEGFASLTWGSIPFVGCTPLLFELSDFNGEVILSFCEGFDESHVKEAFANAGLELNPNIKWETLPLE